jgi:hypothetical protein
MDRSFVTPLQATLDVIPARAWRAALSGVPPGHVRENQYQRLRIAYRSEAPFEGRLRPLNVNRVVLSLGIIAARVLRQIRRARIWSRRHTPTANGRQKLRRQPTVPGTLSVSEDDRRLRLISNSKANYRL